MKEMTEVVERGVVVSKRKPVRREDTTSLQTRLAELEESNTLLSKALEESNSALRILESYNKKLEDDLRRISKKRVGAD